MINAIYGTLKEIFYELINIHIQTMFNRVL
jgi:hypothetical protein